MAKIGTDIEYASALLRENKLVGIPTDTVYGVAGNALNEQVVSSIFEVKKRPLNLPLIVQVNRIRKVKMLIKGIPESAKILAQNYWPGSLTMVLEKSDIIPDILVSGGSTLGIRIPDHMATLELLFRLDFPLAVPSANLHGEKSPLTAEEVNDQIGDQIDYILDGGKCSLGIESTIVGFDAGNPVIFRLGALTKDEIESTIKRERTTLNPQANLKREPK